MLPLHGQSHGSPSQRCWGRPERRQSAQAAGPPGQSQVPPIPSDARTQLWAFPGSPRLLVKNRWKKNIHIKPTLRKKCNKHTHTHMLQSTNNNKHKHQLTYKHHGGFYTVRFIPLKEKNISEQKTDSPIAPSLLYQKKKKFKVETAFTILAT